MKQADLSPPLGVGGGTCKVVQRIEEAVRVPSLRQELAEKVETGDKLTNPEAAMIYDMGLPEQGAGLFTSIRISAHAQYRMDQRGITVQDLQKFFQNLSKKVNDWKSQRALEFQQLSEAVASGGSFEWTDTKNGNLKVAFQFRGRVVNIITTFWQGKPDPRPGSCGRHKNQHRAVQVEDLSGYRTLVTDPSPDSSAKSPYPVQGDPRPSGHGRSKPSPTPAYNGPGESGSSSDGSLHKDRVRTKGVPGGQYGGGATHPLPNVTDSKVTPNRRPALTAGMEPPAYPSDKERHRKQKGEAYRYDHKRYQKMRGVIKQRQKRRHQRLKMNFQYQLDRQRRKENPERFRTKPSGGVRTIQERNQRQRSKKAFESFPFYCCADGDWGVLRSVTPQGVVHYQYRGEERVTDLDTFLDAAVVDEDYFDAFQAYLDQVFGYDPSEDGLWKDVVSFYREQFPVDVPSENKYDRAQNHDEWSRKERPRLEDISEWTGKNEGNPGSRVLPSGKDHVEKSAALISEIRQGCSADLLGRSRGLKVSLRRVDAANALWLFDVQGSKEPYQVRLKAEKRGNIKDVGKLHVKVSCSCPFWLWQGPEHWAKQGDYLYGKPVGTATKPDIKDPQGEHRACKHVLACLDWVVGNKWQIQKRASGTVDRLVLRYLVTRP